MEDKTISKVSMSQNLIMGLQHVLTMCPGSIAVPLILGSSIGLDGKDIALLIAANLFTSGIAVLIQVIGIGKHIGSRLPIVLGSAFAPLAAMIVIGKDYGMPILFGSIIGSGIAIFLISFFLKRILKFFPQVIVGCFVTLLGISLAPSAFSDVMGGEGSAIFGRPENLVVGLIVLLIIVLLNRFGNGLIRSVSLLIGLGAGTIISIPLGMVNVEPVAEAAWFSLIKPFAFGAPQFKIVPILIITIFSIINMIQCLGVYAFLDNVRGTKTGSDQQIDGIRGQAFAQVVSGMFNSFPSTMFNENVSVIKISNISAKSTTITAGAMLIIMGVIPKLSALITCIPKPVIGGATLALFGTITAAGISILSELDFSDDNNGLIIGTGLAVAIGAMFTSNAFDQFPQLVSILFSNGLFVVGVVTMTLNIVLNLGKKKKLPSRADEEEDQRL